MDNVTEIEKIDQVIRQLRILKSYVLKRDVLSKKAFDACMQNSTRRKIEKVNADLNWHCMSLDKHRVLVSKVIQQSGLLVSTEPREYNPSAFHNYKG